jgi:hypothetical protein
METLIKTLYGENGELYTTAKGRRILLTRVVPKFELYEHTTSVPVLGKIGYGVKTRRFTLVICPGENTTRAVDADFLRSVSRFDLVVDMQREDGIFERMKFDGLIPQEIDLDGDWVFESDNADMVKKLLEF